MAGDIYFGTDKSIKVGRKTNDGYVRSSTFLAFGDFLDAALGALDPKILASIKELEPLMMYEFGDLDADEYNLVIRTMRQHVAAVVQPSASEEEAIWVWKEMAEPFIRKDARYDFAYHGEQPPIEPSE
jgi:hypothetical protein